MGFDEVQSQRSMLDGARLSIRFQTLKETLKKETTKRQDLKGMSFLMRIFPA